MKMKHVVLATMAAILIISAACTPRIVDGMMTASGTTLQSNHSRVESPEVASEDQAALSEGNGTFALDLYQQLQKTDGNLFYSPYSISAALAMTYAGAVGTTAEQMADTLHFTLPQEGLHPAFNWLERELNSRGEGEDAEAFRLSVTNAIWGQKDYKFKVTFLDTLAENYGAGLRIVNYGNPDESRLTINDWVSEQTEERIRELLPSGSITTDTKMVLTNAIYFKAAWKWKFIADNTHNQDFHLLDGGSISVPMMHQTMLFGYAEGEGYQAVELPYKGGEFAMMVLLPDEGEFAEFESSLDYRKLTAIVSGIQERNTVLTMPRFRFESAFSLKEPLFALGMVDAFDEDSADFSGMTDVEKLWLDDVYHKAFVAVDENGTEASAATGAVTVASMPATVTIDRPFIFLIRDIETGAILFMGRVVNPVA